MSIITPNRSDDIVGKPKNVDEGSPSSQRIIITTVKAPVAGKDGDPGAPSKASIIKQTAKA